MLLEHWMAVAQFSGQPAQITSFCRTSRRSGRKGCVIEFWFCGKLTFTIEAFVGIRHTKCIPQNSLEMLPPIRVRVFLREAKRSCGELETWMREAYFVTSAGSVDLVKAAPPAKACGITHWLK